MIYPWHGFVFQNSGSNFEPCQLSEESHELFLSQASNINATIIQHPSPAGSRFHPKMPRFFRRSPRNPEIAGFWDDSAKFKGEQTLSKVVPNLVPCMEGKYMKITWQCCVILRVPDLSCRIPTCNDIKRHTMSRSHSTSIFSSRDVQAVPTLWRTRTTRDELNTGWHDFRETGIYTETSGEWRWKQRPRSKSFRNSLEKSWKYEVSRWEGHKHTNRVQ